MAKDLVGTWKKLLDYCRRYIAAIVIALICSAVGTVLTLIGPDKLSDMTECITAGIAPDTEKLEEITTAMSDHISANLELVISNITANISDQTNMSQKAGEILASGAVSEEDKLAFQQTLMSMSGAASEEESQALLMTLPESVLSILFERIEVNGSVIPGQDQVQALTLLGNLDEEDTETMQSALTELPETVKNALYTEITVDGVGISGEDQIAMMETFGNLDSEDTEASVEMLETLPDSVYSVIQPSIDMNQVRTIGLTLVMMYVLSYIFSAVQSFTMATVTQRVSKQMRTEISGKINRLPMWFYNKTTTGDVLSRVTNDVDTIGQSLNQSISSLVSSMILFVGSFVMMLKTDGWMTLTAVAASLMGFVFMFMIMGRSQKYFARQQKHLGAINGHIEEMYAGHTVVRAYNGEEESCKTFDQMNRKLQESGFRAQCLAGLMQPIMSFIGNLGYVAVCVVGGAMALKGKIGFGVIVAFMMYVRYFTQPLSQIAQAMQSLQSAAAAGERVFEFLEAEEMEEESSKVRKLDQARGTVEFDHVKFGDRKSVV